MAVDTNLRTKRERLERLRSQLELERSSWLPHWRELSDFINPRRSRFQITEANRGERRSQKIIDSTATLAARTLRSGMMAGITSPARPWFRLSTPDPDLAESGAVKDWLHTVTLRMHAVFLKTNLYNTLHTGYGDIGTFGTAAMYMEEMFDGTVFRTYPFPIGSYMLAQNDACRVDTFVREFRMTVRQLVEKFGYPDVGDVPGVTPPDLDVFTTGVRRMWEEGNREHWIDVVHIIYPNPEYDPERPESRYKKFASCYYERGMPTGQGRADSQYEGKFLSESGYDFFPVLCPRWETTAEDVYGTSCPGMIALGDIKQLQTGERRGAQAIEKMVMPPLVGPSRLKTTRVSGLPGDITYLDDQGGQGLRPIHEVRFSLQELEAKQAQVRFRIQRTYYEDIMQMLTQLDRRQITAREIEERHEEKLLVLGPVLERLNEDQNTPLIDNAFQIMLRQGLIPEPPEELQGVDLKVEYISVMAQAQKTAGLAGIERFAGFVQGVAALDPQVLDKIDRDQMVDEVGEITGVPPRIIVPDEEVVVIRQQRAQAQQAALQAKQITEMSGAAKDLATAPMDTDSALSRLVSASNAGAITP